jgi:hypothetical protein
MKASVVMLSDIESRRDPFAVCGMSEDKRRLTVFTDEPLMVRRKIMVTLCGDSLVSLTSEGISARIVEPVEADVELVRRAEGTSSVHYEFRVPDEDTKLCLLSQSISVNAPLPASA